MPLIEVPKNHSYPGMCNYDGTHCRTVIENGVRHIFSLTVFEKYIYWSDWHDGVVSRAHKYTGKDRITILTSLPNKPMGIKVGRKTFSRTLDF